MCYWKNKCLTQMLTKGSILLFLRSLSFKENKKVGDSQSPREFKETRSTVFSSLKAEKKLKLLLITAVIWVAKIL